MGKPVWHPHPGDVTRLLQCWSAGEKSALAQLTPLVYRELKKIAAAYLRRERSDHTLQPTALVHEVWIQLTEQSHLQIDSRPQFFAATANLMRQILVSHARRRGTAKRGRGAKITLIEEAGAVKPRAIDLVALDEALDRLAELDPRQSRIVELRFFGGLTEEEIAGVLDISAVTVKRHWRVARAALYGQLSSGSFHESRTMAADH